MPAAKKVILKSEDDAINLLEKLLDNKINTDHLEIEFDGWPHFHMHVHGDKYHQTITPSIMNGLLDLQNGIYKSYAMLKYDAENAQSLTRQERQDLEIEVKVEDGSSEFDINLTEIGMKLIESTAGKMSAEQAMILVMAMLILYFGKSGIQLWLENRKEIRQAELEAQKNSEERQERLETLKILTPLNPKVEQVIAKAQVKDERVKKIVNNAADVNASIVKSVQNAEVAEIQNAVEIPGDVAKEIAITPKSRWEAVRIDDWYRVLEVDSSNAANRKIRVKRIKDHKEFITVLENDSLDQKNLQLIQQAEWKYAKIYLNIEALTLNGRHKEAKILGAVNIDEDDTEE